MPEEHEKNTDALIRELELSGSFKEYKKTNEGEFVFESGDGSSFSAEEETCPFCGAKLRPGAVYCPVCMQLLKEPRVIVPPDPERKIRSIPVLVLLFFLLIAVILLLFGLCSERMPADVPSSAEEESVPAVSGLPERSSEDTADAGSSESPSEADETPSEHASEEESDETDDGDAETHGSTDSSSSEAPAPSDTSAPETTAPVHTHDFRLIDSKSPTCTEAGFEKYQCSCGEIKTVDVPAKGHDWDGPTCTTAAVCRVCGAAGDGPLGHGPGVFGAFAYCERCSRSCLWRLYSFYQHVAVITPYGIGNYKGFELRDDGETESFVTDWMPASDAVPAGIEVLQKEPDPDDKTRVRYTVKLHIYRGRSKTPVATMDHWISYEDDITTGRFDEIAESQKYEPQPAHTEVLDAFGTRIDYQSSVTWGYEEKIILDP
ncbi:MAG: hypothetical protein IJM76_05185 [Lachnospiraceae bacterium]|nr:hypothetical protein [Lachnospiraceae bacterium]